MTWQEKKKTMKYWAPEVKMTIGLYIVGVNGQRRLRAVSSKLLQGEQDTRRLSCGRFLLINSLLWRNNHPGMCHLTARITASLFLFSWNRHFLGENKKKYCFPELLRGGGHVVSGRFSPPRVPPDN